MKKRKQFLLLMGILLSMQFVFAKDFSDGRGFEVLKEKLVTEPTNRHWILSKFAGWKAAKLIGSSGFAVSMYCWIKSAFYHLQCRSLRKPKEEGVYIFSNGEYFNSLLHYSRSRSKYAIAAVFTFITTIIIAVSAGVVTKRVVKKSFCEAFEDYIKNWEEERLNAPKEFIPILDAVAQEYALSENKSQYVRAEISGVLEIIFGEKII